MSHTISPHRSGSASPREIDDLEVMPAVTPPSTAGSSASAETVTTNDEDARRCEEWELFADFAQPLSAQEYRSSTAATHTRSSSPNPKNHLSDEDSDNDCDSVSGSHSGSGSSDEDSDSDGREELSNHDNHCGLDDLECSQVPGVVASPTCGRQQFPDVEPSEDLASSRSPIPPMMPKIRDPETPSVSRPPSARSGIWFTKSARAGSSLPTSSRIRVYVRIRPQSQGESEADVVARGDGTNRVRVTSLSTGSVTESVVDGVFADQSAQQDVYAAVNPGIVAALEGMNATIFAYGQTGTGKTFTMFGDDTEAQTIERESSLTSRHEAPSGWGLIPRAFWELCSKATTDPGTNSRVQLSCSFLQIYNDRVFDLLIDRKRQKPLALREQPTMEGGTHVVLQGLSSEIVSTFSDALQFVRRGRANRSVRETESNSCSSRSHAIVQINLCMETLIANGTKRMRTSRLNLVDLAGSEKWNTDVHMEDHHAAELKNINVSLSALGNCIAALAESGRRHIPYRDSTLTRLLQDSFGGNALAFLIATVSASSKASEETIRTLQFADRARSVMQVVRVNESFNGSSELLAAKAQIQTLRQRLSVEQRRRHEIRIKELDALQRDFASKLQEKDEELTRLRRDNDVFTKWREEDAKRIRALETRLKELDNLQHEQQWAPTNKTGSMPQFNLPELESNQSVEEGRDAIPQRHGGHESEWRPLVKKNSIRTRKNQASGSVMSELTLEKVQKPRIQSYRSLIDKYSHSNKVKSADVQQNVQKPLAAPPSAHSKPPSDQLDHSYASPDTRPAQNQLQLPRSTSDTSFASPSPLGRSTEVSGSSYTWCRPSESDELANTNSASAASSYSGPLWKIESLPSLPKVGHGPSVPCHHPASYPPVATMPNQARSLTYTGVPAWEQLPLVQSNPGSEAVRNEATYSVAANQVCGKHSLKGCVLCAVNNVPQAMPAIMTSSNVASKSASFSLLLNSSATSSTSSQLAITTVDARLPCERHQLPGCFICVKTTSDTSWRATASFGLTATSATTASAFDVPKMDSSSSHRPMQETKCSTHMLANCVLCAGTCARVDSAPPPSLEALSSPTKRSYHPSDSLAPLRSNSISTAVDTGSYTETMGRSYGSFSSTKGITTTAPSFDPAFSKPPLSYGLAMMPSSGNRFTNESESRKQFHSLLREASDAATIALRRRA